MVYLRKQLEHPEGWQELHCKYCVLRSDMRDAFAAPIRFQLYTGLYTGYNILTSIKQINKGEKLTKNNLWVKRPGNGYFNSDRLKDLFGRTAKQLIKDNTQIKKNDIK